MDLKNKKILVTGADGFIGSHLVEKLYEIGANVKALSYYNSFNYWGWLETLPKDILNNIEIIQGDIRDKDLIYKIVKDVEVIFHLAALIAIPYSYIAYESYFQVNVLGTLNILSAASKFNILKVIHTSTSEVYGSAQYVPIDEKHPLNPQSPYAASKVSADMMALSFNKSFNTNVAIIRPFNTFGPRQSMRAVIPTIITQVLSGNKKIKLGLLTPKRDFNYIKNTIDGFIKVATYDNTIDEVINIGSQTEYSIYDVINLVKEITNIDFEVESEEQRLRPKNSEVDRLLCDISKAKKMLNYEPKYSFKEGLIETIQWFEKNLHYYKSKIYNI